MNKRIEELIKSRGIIPEDEHYEIAELIVKECANRATWAQDTNEQDVGGEILKHFGVE